MGMQQRYSTRPFCHAGVPLDCTLSLQISVLIRTLNFSSHLLLPTRLARQITPQGIQGADMVGSESRRWGEKAKRRVETLGVCWPQNQGSRGLGKVWGLRGTTRVDPEPYGLWLKTVHRLTQCLSNPWADDRRVEDDRCRPSWRVDLHKLLEMILGLVFIMLSTPVLALVSKWDFSGSFLAAVPNLQPLLTMYLSLQGVPSSLCTSISHHLSSPTSGPQTFPNYSNPHVCKPLLPIRDPIQFSVWLLCFS